MRAFETSLSTSVRWSYAIPRPDPRMEPLLNSTSPSAPTVPSLLLNTPRGVFRTNPSLSRSVTLETDADGEWRHPIETVAKSERGLERTVQGEAVMLGWPVAAGRGRVRIPGGAHGDH